MESEIFGVATLVVLLFVFATEKRHPDTLGIAVMLLFAWALTNVQDALWEPPVSKAFNSVTDLTIGMLALTAFALRRQTWMLAIALLFGVQSVVHVIYQGAFGSPWVTTYNYVALLNTTFAIQLAVVASPGMGDVVRSISDMRRRALAGHPRGAWP